MKGHWTIWTLGERELAQGLGHYQVGTLEDRNIWEEGVLGYMDIGA